MTVDVVMRMLGIRGSMWIRGLAAVAVTLLPALPAAAFDEFWLPAGRAIPTGPNARIEALNTLVNGRTVAYTAAHATGTGGSDCFTWHRSLPANYSGEMDAEIVFVRSGRCVSGSTPGIDCYVDGDCSGGTCPANTSVSNSQVSIGCAGTGQSYTGLDILDAAGTFNMAAPASFGLQSTFSLNTDSAIDETNCTANEQAAIRYCLLASSGRAEHIIGLRIKYPCVGPGACSP